MYSIIQFCDKDGGTVSIVNNQWLTPRRCEVFWPPVKGTKAFNRILSQDATPDEKWKLYGVQKVFYETDNIEKARKKLKLVEDTSDLQTEEDIAHTPKRKVQKTKRYISSSGEDDYDTHIRPPLLKSKVSPTLIKNYQAESSNKRTETSALETHKSNSNDVSSLSVDDLPVLTSSTVQDLADETVQLNSAAQLASSHQGRQLHLAESSSLKSSLCVAHLTGYQSQMLSILTVIKTQNTQIIHMLKQNSNAQKCTLKPDFKLPINTAEELNTIEILLSNQENYDNLVSYIRTLGGKDVSSKVSRIMKLAFTDQLAEQYNFYGKRSNKKPFYQLGLRDSVVDGVVTTTSGATAKEIEDCIKICLKHAPERLKNKSKSVRP